MEQAGAIEDIGTANMVATIGGGVERFSELLSAERRAMEGAPPNGVAGGRQNQAQHAEP
jgi:hypothetical protein